MGNPELSHQIGQTAHNAKEAGRLLLDSNLFQNLQDIGHPYGLLLDNPAKSPTFLDSLIKLSETELGQLSGETFEFILNSWVELKVGGLPEKKQNQYARDKFKKKIPLGYWPGSSIYSSLFFLDGVISEFISDNAPGIGMGSVLSKVIKSEKKEPGEAALTLPLITPFLKLVFPENSPENRKTEFRIGRSGVSLGTSSIHLKNYKGEEPFIIKTPQGEPVAQINPGDPLGSMHVSQQASLLRKLSPLEKIQAVTSDILSLFTAIDQPEQSDLSSKQQNTLEQARSATVIGISHLTRLLRRKTGLHTWKLDVLPEAVQNLHQFDSQAVSDRFGGGRKVKPEDIEMLLITPEQRQMLVATA